jgi:acyl-CoA hydrolase
MAAFPQTLVDAMVSRSDDLREVEIVHLHTEGLARYAEERYKDSFFVNNLFIGSNTRKAVDDGRADYVPVFLSEIPAMFRKGVLPVDVALVNVSPPDKHGYCSLGVSVDVTLSAVQSAKIVIAQINPRMPRTHGDGNVHISRFDTTIDVDDELPVQSMAAPTETELKIGQLCAQLIEDGATLQMGIGAIPNAVLASLTDHKGLGVHTEMFSDGVVNLVEKGVITNENKAVHPGRIVSGSMSSSTTIPTCS